MGVNFEEKLRNQQYDDLWQEYCGFLDLDIGGYMQIQRRLMEEQIGLWSASALGKKLLDGGRPRTVEEFRRAVPLTTFEDYADVLLQKRSEMLPAEPVVWIQTTWEGGKHPIKLAPYTRGMLDVFKHNMVAALMLATSKRPGQFSIAPCDRTLYGLAPLPYVTGLFPLMLDEELPLRFLPPVDEAVRMSFGERNKKGFALGLQNGLDLFFGLSSVISYITTSFTAGGGKSKKNLFQYSPAMVCRYLAASYRAKRDGRTVQPKDIFRLKALICAGTDTSYYKPSLEEAWGVRPMEIYAGTEPTLMATETWARNGLVFFPDNCFYEFIPEGEMYKNLDDRTYQPKTCLMDELTANQNYEVVITVLKGGRIRPLPGGGRLPVPQHGRRAGGGAPAALYLRGPDPHRHRHRRLHPHHRGHDLRRGAPVGAGHPRLGGAQGVQRGQPPLPAPLPRDRLRVTRGDGGEQAAAPRASERLLQVL